MIKIVEIKSDGFNIEQLYCVEKHLNKYFSYLNIALILPQVLFTPEILGTTDASSE